MNLNKSDNNVYFIQWNARSIKNKGFWLNQSIFENADILLIQETFLTPEDNLNIKNKVTYREDRPSRGGGLLTAINKKLPSQKVNLNPPTSENEILCVKVYIGSKWTTFVNIYSPKGRFTKNWLNYVTKQIHDHTYLVGDFNIHHPHLGSPNKSQDGDKVMDWIMDNELVLLNTKQPTHFSRNSQALLDLTLGSKDLGLHTDLMVLEELYDSDHYPIQIKPQLRLFKKTECLEVKRIHWKRFQENINTSLNNKDNLTSMEDLTKTIREAKDESLQSKTKVYEKAPPYWTLKCNALLQKKRYLFKEAKRNINNTTWNNYKKVAAQLRKLIKDLKEKYWDNICKEAGENGRIYKILKTIKEKNLNTGSSNHVIKIKNIELFTPLAQANAFVMKYTRSSDLPEVLLNYNKTGENLKEKFKLTELQEVIRKMKNRSPGPDNISTKMIKQLSEDNLKKLLDLYNNLWEKGEVPDEFKRTTVVPIRKPNKNREDIDSYRPIALTSILSKTFEKIIVTRITKHITKNNLLNPYHYGFLRNRGCEEAQVTIFTKILNTRINKKKVVLISLDLKEAYDSVWPSGLMMKMIKMGLPTEITQWTHEFIKKRKIKVRWRGTLSEERIQNRGVPQGSVISPILFTIFMHDVFENIPENTQIVVFADDINMIVSGNTTEEIKANCQEAIDSISKWCDKWKLTLQTKKSVIINMSKGSNNPRFDTILKGETIPWSSEVKILGIWFTPNLLFNHHIKKTCEKASKQINLLRAIGGVGWGVRSDHLLTIANSCIRSNLEYAPQIIMNASKTSRKKLKTIYNNMLRQALGLPKWTPMPVLYAESGQPNLTERIKQRNLTAHINLIKNRSPIVEEMEQIKDHCTNNVFQKTSFCLEIEQKLRELKVEKRNILQASTTKNLESIKNLNIYTDNLQFQVPKSNPHEGIQHLLNDYLNTMPKTATVIATDASKSKENCAVAIINFRTQTKLSGTIHQINSIFSGEAIAIIIAIEKYAKRQEELYIFTDSLSVLSALKSGQERKSTVIERLSWAIEKSSQICNQINLIWIPGHSNLKINEIADKVAKEARNKGTILRWIVPEDIAQEIKRRTRNAMIEEWEKSKYTMTHPNLTKLDKRTKKKIGSNRKQDVLLTRIRTKTLPTNGILKKIGLAEKDECTCGREIENLEHILLSCPLYENERNQLRKSIGITPLSFGWLASFEDEGETKARALKNFFKEINKF